MESSYKNQERLNEILRKADEEERQRKFSVKSYRRLTNAVKNCMCCGSRSQMIELKNGRCNKEGYIVTCLYCGRHTTEKVSIEAARYEWELMQNIYEEVQRDKERMREAELAEEEEAEEKKKEREAKGEGLGLGFSMSI